MRAYDQMKKEIVAILGKRFEYVRIEDIRTDHPSIFIEDRNVKLCIEAVEKLDIKIVYTETKTIDYLSLSVFKDVTQLSVSGFNLDTSPIQHLKKLKRLSLSNYNEDPKTKIDFSCFKDLHYLWCDMPNNYTNFTALTQLEKLVITGFKEKDLLAISDFSKLKELELMNPEIKSFKGIANVERLKVQTAMNLESFDGIEQLDKSLISCDLISLPSGINFSLIGQLQNLKRLVIRGVDKLEDISSFASLTALEELRIHVNGTLKSLHFLEALHKLKYFSIEADNIASEENVKKPYIRKLGQLNDLERVISWEGIYAYLDQSGKEHYDACIEALEKQNSLSSLEIIKNDFQFYQEEFYDEMGYTKTDCARIDQIIFTLIDKLEKNKNATTKKKISYFKSCVFALNDINEELNYIATGEREYLCDTIEEIANATGIDQEIQEGDITAKWRNW